MMVIHNEFVQGSLEWMCSRIGIPTASELDSLVTPKFEIRKGKLPETYLFKKLAEKWRGSPLREFASWDMDIGTILEKEAKPQFALDHSVDIQSVGLVTTEDGRVACSPDGLIGDNSGIEIKSPAIHTHVGYLMENCVPDGYLAQVHGSMYVTGRPEWWFYSYNRSLPALEILVERDDKIQAAIDEAVLLFLDRLERGYQRLCEINGGPPTRPDPPSPPPAPTEFTYDESEEIVP